MLCYSVCFSNKSGIYSGNGSSLEMNREKKDSGGVMLSRLILIHHHIHPSDNTDTDIMVIPSSTSHTYISILMIHLAHIFHPPIINYVVCIIPKSPTHTKRKANNIKKFTSLHSSSANQRCFCGRKLQPPSLKNNYTCSLRKGEDSDV